MMSIETRSSRQCHPQDDDYLFEQDGTPVVDHQGNRQYNKVIERNKDGFGQAKTSLDKRVFARRVVEFLEDHNDGRFLQKQGKKWEPLKKDVVIQLTMQCLAGGDGNLPEKFKPKKKKPPDIKSPPPGEPVAQKAQKNKRKRQDGRGDDENVMKPPKAGTFVKEPAEIDVIHGRGGVTNKHPGNVTFRNLVILHVPLYTISQMKEKKLLAETMVKAHGEIGGRFLKQDVARGGWYVVGPEQSIRKTMQTLREGSAKEREEKEAQEAGSFVRPPPTSPIDVVSQIGMKPFFLRWLKRIHLDMNDPFGFKESDDEGGSEDGASGNHSTSGPTKKKAKSAMSSFARQGNLGLLTSALSQLSDDYDTQPHAAPLASTPSPLSRPSAAVVVPPAPPPPPSSSSSTGPIRVTQVPQSPVPLPASQVYQNNGQNKGVLLAMALGISGPDRNFQHPPFNTMPGYHPTTKQLADEVARRCAIQNIPNSLRLTYTRVECIEWLSANPMSQKHDIAFVNTEMNAWVRSLTSPPSPEEQRLLEYHKLLNEAEKDYTEALKTLSNLKFRCATVPRVAQDMMKDTVEKVDANVASKAMNIQSLKKRVHTIEKELASSSIFDDPVYYPQQVSPEPGYVMHASPSETWQPTPNSVTTDITGGNNSMATLANGMNNGNSSLDFLAAVASKKKEKEEDDTVHCLLKKLSVHGSATQIEEALQELSAITFEDENNRATLVRSAGVPSIMSMMEQFELEAGIQVAGCAVLWALTKSEGLISDPSLGRAVPFVLHAMKEHSQNSTVQTYGCVFLDCMAQSSKNRRKISKEGGVNVLLETLMVHRGNQEVRTRAIQCLQKLGRELQRRKKGAASAIETILSVMRIDPNDVTTEIGCLTLLCNTCYSRRWRRHLASSTNIREICTEIISHNPDSDGITNWTRRMLDWISGPTRSLIVKR